MKRLSPSRMSGVLLCLSLIGGVIVVRSSHARQGTIPFIRPLQVIPIDKFRGDVFPDGIVNVRDAVLVLKYLVGLESFNEQQQNLADANADGQIDIGDVVYILRVDVGLEDPIECNQC